MDVEVMKFQLGNFGDSTYEWNTVIFAFKIALYNIKMNGTIHHKNIKFHFPPLNWH